MNQRLTWTALPNGIIDRHGSKMLRLSVRMTPRLTPDGESSPIDLFDDFKRWPEKSWSFSVLFGDYPTSGPVTPTFTSITPVANVSLDADLWRKLFIDPKPVPVRNRVPGDYSKAKLRSFPASRVLDVIRTLYTQVALESPTELPSPSWLYGRRGDSVTGGNQWRGSKFRLLDLPERDPVNKLIDGMIEENHGVMPHTYAEDVDETLAIQFDFCQAEYFHAPKTRRGVDRYDEIKTERPDPDFHQILALLSDYPVLMRTLGLIFDLEVPVPANIGSVSEKIVRIWPENPLVGDTSSDVRKNESKIALATRYDFRPALDIFSPLASGTLVKNGYLDLSGSDFAITQVDVDGSAIKAINFAGTLASLSLKKPVLGTPHAAGLPALRSGGLSVMMDNRAADLLAKIKNGAGFESKLVDPATRNSIRFNAEDLIRGNCIDIWDETTGRWRSLCKRSGTYTHDSGTGSTEVIIDEKHRDDEGTLSVAVTASCDPDMPKDIYLHEALFHWNGWSLVVPPPGKSIGKPEKDNVSNVNYEPTELTNVTGLSTSFTVTKGTLPKLRYGRRYRMRARVVDIAGNSLTNDDKNESCATASTPYLRFEPVQSPAIISVSNLPGESLGLRPGESADRLVIRSEAGKESVATDETTSRVILPPRTAVEIAGLHGMLDTPLPPGCAATWYEELCTRDAAAIDNIIASEAALDEAPYLPDPIAKGATFIGLPGVDAPFMFQTGFNAACAWPHAATFKIELREGESGYEWQEDARKLVVSLPKAERITVRMSSNLGDSAALSQMGIWQWIEESAPAGWREKLSKVAAEGRHWMITPFRELTFVHAVQKPLAAPSVQGPSPLRSPAETFFTLAGLLHVHGKSTDKVDFHATWNDVAPAPDKPDGFSFVARKGDAASFQITDPDTTVTPMAVRHELGDTKHRRIAYHATATTCFKEYFEPELENTNFINPSTIERPADFVLVVPSSARPLAPTIEYIIPSFDWKEERKDDGVFRSRGGNSLRVYMSGDWFSSGEGELLGVVLAHGPLVVPSDGLNNNEKMTLLGQAAPVPPDTLKILVTRWGADPIRITGAVHQTPTVHHFPAATARGTDLILDEHPVLPTTEPFWGVAVAGHPVAYDSERKLWYCDVVIDAGPSYFPFVRLALARYQPCSVAGTELSRVIVADCVQTTPDRLLWTSADPNNPFGVRVSLSGVAPRFNGNIACPNRVVARVEVSMPGTSAPVWVPVDAPWTALSEMQVSKTVSVWSGEVFLPQIRGSQRYRLVVEEYEFLNTDPDRGLVNSNAMQLRSMVNIGKSAVWPRIVYSDVVELDTAPEV
jgi:hypothetical protein